MNDDDHIRTITAERDEARRGWARLCVSEYGTGGVFGERRFAAEKWGRAVALALYPDEMIRARLDEFYCDEDEIATEMAEERAAFDKEFPT